ncbi:MAG: carbohydrate-binding domain-containing protein [Oscillospiraceae bacterium]|nr:carbohydrate-binding domain-containing protein [Oscillospiraceae bacterium]
MNKIRSFAAAILVLAAGACSVLSLSGCSASGKVASSVVASDNASSYGTPAPSVAASDNDSSYSTPAGETPSASVSPIADAAPSAEPSPSEVSSTEASAAPVSYTSPEVSVVTVSDAGGMYRAADLFTERDLTQSVDLSDASFIDVSDGEDVHITQEGIYVLGGSAGSVTVYVEAGSADKVQLVLNSLSISNEDFPCIYVKQADKVFVTLVGENFLSVTGTFESDGKTNTDGVIFSKSDLVLNGTGSLDISSSDNGIVCKDDLKITGGNYTVSSSSKCFEANDSIRIAGGTFTLKAGTDCLHAENDDDPSLGYICIFGGSFEMESGDDCIHGESVVQIDSGSFAINAAEGIEATFIQINGGTISISSWDDGINAAQKSSAYRAAIEINGGEITIVMGAGDTDGIDSNGDIIINGGTINVTGNSAFDYDGNAEYNNGTIIVNGREMDEIPNQFFGGMGPGGFGGKGFRP